MSEENSYPTVCPYLVVPDGDALIAFIRAAFDADLRALHRAPDGSVMHAELRLGDSLVMIGTKPPGQPASLHLAVADVDEAYARAIQAGGGSEREPENQSYGSRSAGVSDPAGNTWWIAGPLR